MVGSRRLKRPARTWSFVGRGKAEPIGMRGSPAAPLPHITCPIPLSYHLHRSPGT
jgi:hypothetical protein